MINQIIFNHLNLHNKHLVWWRFTRGLLLALLITCSALIQAQAAVQTQGYWAGGNINGVSFNGNGTFLEQNLPTTNPDVFCAMQEGGNKRLPLMGEMNIAYLGKPPLTDDTNTVGGASYLTRKAGSLVSEWGGHIGLYSGSGWYLNDPMWNSSNYWVAEPGHVYPGAPDLRSRRHVFPFNSPTGGFLANGDPENYYYVACVRTL